MTLQERANEYRKKCVNPDGTLNEKNFLANVYGLAYDYLYDDENGGVIVAALCDGYDEEARKWAKDFGEAVDDILTSDREIAAVVLAKNLACRAYHCDKVRFRY